MKILVVDDHAEVLELVGTALARDQHQVFTAETGERALELFEAHGPDIALVDLGLPGLSGLELCRKLRELDESVGLLVLTAESAVASRVRCLDAGADDYLTKPFAVAELRARVRALSRRARPHAALHLEHRNIELDFARRKARVGTTEAPVTAREWDILELLGARRGHVVSRSVLLERIWGNASESAAASLEVLVGRIRRKLGESLIRTVRNEGYALGDE
jgi:DNA-binding response OmpR family regulator